MKKLQPFLLVVGATCIILLGGLWSAGLLKIGPGNEKGSPLPDGAAKGSPSPDSPKQVEQQSPLKLIVGKWQSQLGKMVIRKEYRENGTVMEYPAFGSPKKGTYKLLNDTSIEYEWPADKDKMHKSIQVSVGKNELAETSGDEWASFTLKYKRVDDFPPILTKEDSQKGDTQDPVQKVAKVEASVTFKKHEASVESVAVSPDGMLIASGGGDGVILIWERATGKVKHKLDTLSRNEGVRGIDFSPDGSTVVCGSRLWNVETGEQRRGIFPGERALVSPDGKLLITATYDEVHAWDLVEDKKVFSKKTPGSISSIAISPDGKLVASGDYSNYVKVWDATTGEQTFSHKDSRAQVYSVAFSPDSTILAVDSGRIYPTLFDLRTSEKVPFKGDLANARFSRPLPLPDGKHMACEMSEDDSIRIWDLSTGQERLILKGHTSPIKAISVSQDGKWLVSASQDHTVKVWDVSSVVEAPIKLVRPQFDKNLFRKRDAIMRVSAPTLSHITGDGKGFGLEQILAISQNEKHAVTKSSDGRIKLWDVGNRKALTEFSSKDYPVVAFSGDSQLFAYCTSEGVKLVNLPGGNERHVLPNPTIEDEKKAAKVEFQYSQLTLSSDGKNVAACGRYSGPSGLSTTGGVVTVWDTTKGNIVTTMTDSKEYSGFTSMAFSPDSEKIAYSSHREVKIWNFSSNRQQQALKTSLSVQRLSWNANGSLLAIAGHGRNEAIVGQRTLLWDTKSDRGTYVMADAAFLSTSNVMVSADSNGVHVLDAAHGLPIFKLNEGGSLRSSTNGGHRLAVEERGRNGGVTMWRIDKDALEMVKQERLSKSPNAKAKVFEIRDGFEVEQDGFWIDKAEPTSFLSGQEGSLWIGIHKGTSFNQPIKVRISSKDGELEFSPRIHEIKAGDTNTKAVVFSVRYLGVGERNYYDIEVTTDPPSSIVRANFYARKVKSPFEKK